MKIPLLLLILLCSCALLPACERPAEIAGISERTQVDQLTAAQGQALCGHMTDHFRDLMEDEAIRHGMCLMEAESWSTTVDDEGRVRGCQQNYDGCMAEYSSQELVDAFDASCALGPNVLGCQVTVAEFDACFQAVFAMSFGRLRDVADVSCQDLTNREGLERMQALKHFMERVHQGDEALNPQACEVVEEKCPGLL